MRQINMHEAKTHLSRLVAEAAEGRPFIIAKAGRPLVEVRAAAPVGGVDGRIGFLTPPPGAQAGVKAVGGDALVDLFEGRGTPG